MEQDLRNPLDQALAAAAAGPFFPDWEFEALFGMSRDEVSALIGTLASATSTPPQRLGLANAVNNLLGYPHGLESQWSRWFTCTPGELQLAYTTWRASIHEA